jgi:hypothetical protein
VTKHTPIQTVIAARRKVVQKLKDDRDKVENEMKAKLAEFDALLDPELKLLHDLEKMAEPKETPK